MDTEILIVFGFILSLILIALGFTMVLHRRVSSHEERKLEIKARIEEAKAAQLRQERQADNLLEERVRVLERIATDRGADLAVQIESLRETQPLLREPAQ